MGSLHGRLRRAAAVVACSGLSLSGVVAVAAQPAAAVTRSTPTATSSAVADSATPTVSQVNPIEAPVGTHVDARGRRHMTKAYFTFDLSPMLGHELLTATFLVSETAVTDCSVSTTPQAWLTHTATKPTWATQPAERVELTGPGQMFGCPDSVPVAWDAGDAVRAALAAGQSRATFVVRLAPNDQALPAHGLVFDPAASLRVVYNILPTRPTGLTTNGTPCGSQPLFVPSEDQTIAATITDPDDTSVDAGFQWWPVAQPGRRTDILIPFGPSGGVSRATIPRSALADATTYAWRVRGVDRATGASSPQEQPQQVDGPFSDVCDFTTDFTPPATAPTVTSTDYPPGVPSGGPDAPGTFSFSGNGDPDIIGFTDSPFSVPPPVIPADRPGGTATTVITPQFFGPNSISVAGVDRAGNVGPITTYQFFVKSNAPTIRCTPETALIGEPRQCTFIEPPGTQSFTYRLDGEPDTTVPADPADSATVTVTPSDPFFVPAPLDVQALLANGKLSGPAEALLDVDPGAPTVDQPATATIGQPLQLTFHALLPGSTTFTYAWEIGTFTIPVGADGTVTVTVSPTITGPDELDVFSTTAAGQDSGTNPVIVEVGG